MLFSNPVHTVYYNKDIEKWAVDYYQGEIYLK